MNKKIRIFIIVAALIVAYLGLTWLFVDEPLGLNDTAALTVTIAHPQVMAIPERINVTGVTIPREAVIVISELSGVRILEVMADVGDVVEQHQILAQLDAQSLTHQVAQLKSDYERALDEFKRVDALKTTGYVSQELIVQKRTFMEAAKAKFDDATLSVQRASIRAPVAGVIYERQAEIGALVSANEPLYRIARDGEIEIEAQIPEAQLSKLQLNQTCLITLSGQATALPGKIRLITPHINPASRTASIRIALDQHNHLPVGLFSQIEIDLQKISGSLLPATALQQDSLGFYVWMLDQDNKAVRLPVDIQLRSNEGIVVADLPADTRIVARAGAFLKEGEQVNVVETP